MKRLLIVICIGLICGMAGVAEANRDYTLSDSTPSSYIIADFGNRINGYISDIVFLCTATAGTTISLTDTSGNEILNISKAQNTSTHYQWRAGSYPVVNGRLLITADEYIDFFRVNIRLRDGSMDAVQYDLSDSTPSSYPVSTTSGFISDIFVNCTQAVTVVLTDTHSAESARPEILALYLGVGTHHHKWQAGSYPKYDTNLQATADASICFGRLNLRTSNGAGGNQQTFSDSIPASYPVITDTAWISDILVACTQTIFVTLTDTDPAESSRPEVFRYRFAAGTTHLEFEPGSYIKFDTDLQLSTDTKELKFISINVRKNNGTF